MVADLMDARCRPTVVARLRGRCRRTAAAVAVAVEHRQPVAEALVAGRQAAVAADTPQLPAQAAAVPANTEAAADTNLTLVAGKITPPWGAAFFFITKGPRLIRRVLSC